MAAQHEPRTERVVGVAAHERVTLKAGRRRRRNETRVRRSRDRLAREEIPRRSTRQRCPYECRDDRHFAARPPRHARVFAVVHEDNVRSIALLRRHGLTDELSRATELSSYRRLVTGHRD